MSTTTPMPKEAPKYNDNAISTELECFIHKSSSSGSIGCGLDDEDIDDIDLSSPDSEEEFDGVNNGKFAYDFDKRDSVKNGKLSNGKQTHIELTVMDKGYTEHDEYENTLNKPHRKHKGVHKGAHKGHHHHHHRRRRRGRCNVMPQWVLYISSLDKLFSSKIHRLSLGSIDYLFVFGAFVFGSKFMPITILLSIFLVDVPGFIYLLLCCTITVSITQFGKRLFGRHRPDPKQLASKRLDFRTRLTNYSFPSGDTAQVCSYTLVLSVFMDTANSHFSYCPMTPFHVPPPLNYEECR